MKGKEFITAVILISAVNLFFSVYLKPRTVESDPTSLYSTYGGSHTYDTYTCL